MDRRLDNTHFLFELKLVYADSVVGNLILFAKFGNPCSRLCFSSRKRLFSWKDRMYVVEELVKRPKYKFSENLQRNLLLSWTLFHVIVRTIMTTSSQVVKYA